MLQQGISRGAENVNDPCFRKKGLSEKSKGLKQRPKALSDVKNTIHSHASNLVEKTKTGDKKAKSSSGFGRSEIKESSKMFNVLEDGHDIKSGIGTSDPEFECINHFVCEKENNFTRAEFFDEYKLTQNELDCFSDRMNIFRIDPPPFKIKPLSPVEDVEFNLTNNGLFYDEDLTGDISIEVPEPLFF